MAECSISTSDLPWHVFDNLFDSLDEETISDDDGVRNNNVGELSNETDHDDGSIFDQYSDASNDKSYSIRGRP